MRFSRPPQQRRMGIAGAAVGCPDGAINRPGSSFQPADEPGTFWRNACRSGGRVRVECREDYIQTVGRWFESTPRPKTMAGVAQLVERQACLRKTLSIRRGASVTRTDFMGLSAGETQGSGCGPSRLRSPANQRSGVLCGDEWPYIPTGKRAANTVETRGFATSGRKQVHARGGEQSRAHGWWGTPGSAIAGTGRPAVTTKSITCKRDRFADEAPSADTGGSGGQAKSGFACVAPWCGLDCHEGSRCEVVGNDQKSGSFSVTDASTKSSAMLRRARLSIASTTSSAQAASSCARVHCSSDIKFSFVHLLVRQAVPKAAYAADSHCVGGLGLAHNQVH